jgi:hypothetical protein
MLRVVKTCGEIFNSDEFLVWSHELLEYTNDIKPIITFPLGVILKTLVEVKTINVDYYPLFRHDIKNKPPL